MQEAMGKEARGGIIRRYASRLRFPQLFAILAGLLVVDFVIPDPIPYIDEVILGILTVLLGMWRRHREDKEQPRPQMETMKNVTPKRDP
jgi:hypothetical protein